MLGNTYRHPAVLANMAATLDLISEGRLVLGIGAGWQKNEHAAYGIPLPELRDRESCGSRPGMELWHCWAELHGESPAQALDLLLAYRDAGVDEFLVCDDAKVPVGQALDQIDAITQTVLPALRVG